MMMMMMIMMITTTTTTMTTMMMKTMMYRIRRSRWPHGLRSRSAAACLLRLWFRNPPVAWISVASAVCFRVKVSLTS
jgi:hypothetical protein